MLVDDRRRILIADDDMMIKTIIMKMLFKMGMGADLASNGQEVLEALIKWPYDVVLMDIQMPEMDGYQVLQAIRKTGKNGQDVPILAMTAHAGPGDERRCLEAGMDDYISKPFKIEELSKILRNSKE